MRKISVKEYDEKGNIVKEILNETSYGIYSGLTMIFRKEEPKFWNLETIWNIEKCKTTDGG